MIKLEGVSKSYDNLTNVVDKLDLEIKTGELVVLVGESGCGKTTTMKMINRLIDPTDGDIFIDKDKIKDLDKNTLRRNIGYVIQNVGLFPHLTIDKNIAVVPTLCKVNKDKIDLKVKELMNMVELPYEDYAHRYPRELSGGQQQRVGVARALANDPDIILMDEPFSAIDPLTREQLQNELLKLQANLNKTIVFVTHDITEAIKLGDRIAVMAKGKIVQYDTPEEILKNPVNKFVEMFVGYDRLWKTPEMLKAKDFMEALPGKQGELTGILGQEAIKDEAMKIPSDMSLVDLLTLRKDQDIENSPVFDENDDAVGLITSASILNVLTDIIPEREVR